MLYLYHQLPKMNAQRNRAPPSISFSPRASLDKSSHSIVDGILKDLKSYSRRLQTALTSYQDEIHVLERLYYKSKNQHRMALFFKRVSEIRRYGWRLLEVNMSDHMHLLRASFYGATVVQSEKLMRASWNHVPSLSYVFFVAERLKACSILILKMSGRVQEAYHQFSLAMQSGAFIQLIVLFAGVSSRMATLLTECGDCVRSCESACDRLLNVLDPAHKSIKLALTDDRHVPSEDIGSIVSRETAVNLPSFAPVNTVANIEQNVEPDILQTVDVMSPPQVASVVAPDQSGPTGVEKGTLSTRNDKIVAKRKMPCTQGRPKKAKNKRDEIDEIFGF